jgi:hypothetical protein
MCRTSGACSTHLQPGRPTQLSSCRQLRRWQRQRLQQPTTAAGWRFGPGGPGGCTLHRWAVHLDTHSIHTVCSASSQFRQHHHLTTRYPLCMLYRLQPCSCGAVEPWLVPACRPGGGTPSSSGSSHTAESASGGACRRAVAGAAVSSNGGVPCCCTRPWAAVGSGWCRGDTCTTGRWSDCAECNVANLACVLLLGGLAAAHRAMHFLARQITHMVGVELTCSCTRCCVQGMASCAVAAG